MMIKAYVSNPYWILDTLIKEGTWCRSCCCKAFDRVDHTIVLNEMYTLGLPGLLLQWITRFLTHRGLRVKVGNTESEWRQVNTGVRRALSRDLCFLFHINDLRATSDIVKYVDDSTPWEVSAISAQSQHLQLLTRRRVTGQLSTKWHSIVTRLKRWWYALSERPLPCLP